VLKAATGELVLVRFSPMNQDRFVRQATDDADYRESLGEERIWAISAYGDCLGEGETVEALVSRICEEAECGGPRIWLITGGTLSREGYDAVLSEPPPHHYDVIIGSELGTEDRSRLVESVGKLAGLFGPGREKNPAC